MEPQPPPTAPSSATSQQPHYHHHYHHHHHHPQRRPDSIPHEHQETYNDKDTCQRLQYARVERGSKDSNGRLHDSVISPPFSPKASPPPSPSSSVSSARQKHPSSSIADIQRPSPVNVSYPPRAHLDPEKALISPHSPPSPDRLSLSNPDITAILYDSGEYQEKEPGEKAVQLLIYLSGPCAFLSFLITIWTMFCLCIAFLLQPLRLCTTRPRLSSQVTTFLAPPLNLQLHIVYSHSSATEYSPSMLVVIHLLSPIVALGVAIAAWTAAFFWFFSAILGDPAGQDGHDDGKDSILGVRNWWDRWLSRGLR